MKILEIRRDQFDVGAVIHESGMGELTCSLMEDIGSIEKSYQASADRLLEYLSKVAESGIEVLNDKQCHCVNKENKIYEFIAGRLRILFFTGTPKSVIVCSHMFLKKTQKTPRVEIDRAVRAKTKYEAAKVAGTVEWKDEI